MRIRRGLGSRRLPCGCLAGIYETYDEQVVTILDVPASGCVNPEHAAGSVVPTIDVPLDAHSPSK